MLAAREWETRGRDVPHVLGLKEYRRFPLAIASLVAQRHMGGITGPVERFPFPKSMDDVREFSLGHPLDEVRLRVLAAKYLGASDALLPAGVAAYRLADVAPGWRYANSDRAAAFRRDEAVRRVEDPGFTGFGRTDVVMCYQSIDLSTLGDLLGTIHPDAVGVREFCAQLSAFTEAAGLTGLPIGPEVSGGLANAYLLPVDRVLMQLGVEHLRVTDDFWVFVDGNRSWDQALSLMDYVFGAMSLLRSEDKTAYYPDRESALNFIRDAQLSAVRGVTQRDQAGARDAVQYLLSSLHDDPSPAKSALRLALAVSGELADTYAIEVLTERPELAELEGRGLGDYALALGGHDQAYLEPLLRLVDLPATDRTEAMQLHVLRGLSPHWWGGDEGKLFGDVVFDDQRPSSTRAWAVSCLSRSPSWSIDDAVDIATDGLTPYLVKRSATLALRNEADARKRSQAAVLISSRDAELAPTAWMADAA